MTAPSLTFVQAVRDFIDLDPDATSRYTDQTIGSNIRQATWFLERATNRLFADRAQTMTFSTNGAASMAIPGLRTATNVSLAGAALVADSGYWLIPDVQQTGVYTGIQLRIFNDRRDGPSFLHYSSWFDRGLDLRGGTMIRALPNDLTITGSWGYAEPDIPEPARFAAKVVAAFITRYPDAVLVGATQTAHGGTIDLAGYPIPVQEFITSWRVEPGVQGI